MFEELTFIGITLLILILKFWKKLRDITKSQKKRKGIFEKKFIKNFAYLAIKIKEWI